MSFRAVVTTIFKPTKDVEALVSKLSAENGQLIVVGDAKGPSEYNLDNVVFLSLQTQKGLVFSLASKLPIHSYARKNLGYLYAIREGADCIYETDDDNAPLKHWQKRSLWVSVKESQRNGWVNVFKYFTTRFLWPRGYPLNCIASDDELYFDLLHEPETVLEAPIQQGLANNSPDVDALWRLINRDRQVTYDVRSSVRLRPGAWCPFNSQSTWWWPKAFPLMYLPSFCSFRMADIWRSFVAQRCLWSLNRGMVFHSAEVWQDRNPHDLMVDFEAEIPGYLGNDQFVKILENLNLQKGIKKISANLRKCYETLVDHDFFPRKELLLVEAWIEDIEALRDRKSNVY